MQPAGPLYLGPWTLDLDFEGGKMKKKHSLLVVDDEPGIVESLFHMLRRDYEVHAATSASGICRGPGPAGDANIPRNI